MQIYESGIYQESIWKAADSDLPWNQLYKKSILVAGATGLIGRCLVDVLMKKNLREGLNCHIYALSRSIEAARKVFPPDYFTQKDFTVVEHNVQNPLEPGNIAEIDYVIHLASNTHPIAYATEPIDTIITNIYGAKNLLDFCVHYHAKRFVFLSSVEVYGENRGDVEKFNEEYAGYLNANTLRAGYPESKRCGEALCQAYIAETGLDIVIPRLPRIYGPTMGESDSKAIAQFIKRAVAKEDIILKSKGSQYYSFLYVIDAVLGMLYILFNGKSGEAYNLADEGHDTTLKELAEKLAVISGTKVVFDVADKTESAGYSTATKACLDSGKIKKTGWKASYSLEKGLRETVEILQGR
ncbi:dTDP-glucose 4,6-dehydratase [Lachnospiraceae bacterium]|nr:dTDP-glucose 4,6-dehydratase [Lachnospiraceae bacterium]